jgi:tetratricopeptide (TPR) repeat protein
MPSRRSPRRPRRAARIFRSRQRAGSAFLLLATLLAACTGRPAPAPSRPAPRPLDLPAQDRRFLIDPVAGAPAAGDAATARLLSQAHQSLLEAGMVEDVEAAANDLLAADPDFPPAHVLLAQADFARGRYREAVSRLAPIAARHPGYVAAQLLLGRAAEKLGDLPVAYAAYRAVAPRVPLAFERTGALHTRALEITANRVEEALRGGDVAGAEAQLARLREWGPAEELTFEAARQVAVARRDPKAELAAVERLAARRPGDQRLAERRAELELEVGDPSKGLEIVQELARRNPGDAALAAKLEAAKFRWRLSLLPPGVQATAALPELTRAQLAVLLYWLVPAVRHARPAAGRIATDVLDHPQREELVRAVNLGLLDVDPRVHRVFPNSRVTRGTTLRALWRALWLFERAHPCVAAGGADPSASALCNRAAACGLLDDAAVECRASAPTSGAEAVELIRRALVVLGSA